MKHLYLILATAAISTAAVDLHAQSKPLATGSQVQLRANQPTTAWARGGDRPVGATAGAQRGSIPANDECSNAIVLDPVPLLDCGTLATAGDNALATLSTDPMDCDDSDAGFRDVWYAFNSGTHAEMRVTIEMMGMADLVLEVLQGCGGTVVGCDVATALDLTVDPNTDYVVRVASNTDHGEGGTFTICVSYIPDSPAPANDHCGDVTPEALTVGSTLTFTGTTAGATDDGDYEPGSELEGELPVVWHAFTTTECSQVVIDFCGTANFSDGYVFISPSCPAGDDYILASVVGYCADDNLQMTYYDLPAGTYYLPVMLDLDVSYGAYTVSASASACGAYCMAGATSTSFEKIASVEIGSFSNPSTATDGYEDFTASMVDLERTTATAVTVTLVNGYSSDEVLLWIDLDQSNTFEANELLWTSALGTGPHAGSITVPNDALLGQTRMRIRMHDSSIGGLAEACGFSSYGQVEDYTANIVLPTGLGEQSAPDFMVYPNPTKGDITITGADLKGNTDIEITDMTGRVVFAEQRNLAAGQPFTLPLVGKLAQGTYVLRLIGANGSSSQPVLVK